MLKRNGFKLRSIAEIRSFVGNGIYKLIERSLPENASDDTVKICYDEFSEYYKINMMNKTKPYDGVAELLLNLRAKGVKTAIVTNKADFAAKKMCEEIFGNKIDLVIGSNGEMQNKPAPDGVLLAIKALKADLNKTVYIGDSEVDAKTALNAKLNFIAVLWGFRDLQCFDEYSPEYIVKSVNELKNILLNDN